jgi:hypothetical protein
MTLALREARYLCFEGGAIAWAYASNKSWRKEFFIIISTFFSFLNMKAQVHALAYHAVRLGGCVSFVTYYLVVLRWINKVPIGTYILRLTLFATVVFKKLKGEGSTLPSCTSMSSTLTVRASSLAGVPVCNLPSLKPVLARDSERPRAGESPIRPAGKRFMPKERA